MEGIELNLRFGPRALSFLISLIAILTFVFYAQLSPLTRFSLCTEVHLSDYREVLFLVSILIMSVLIVFLSGRGLYHFLSFRFSVFDFVLFIFSVCLVLILFFTIVFSTFGLIDMFPPADITLPQGVYRLSNSWWSHLYFSTINLVGYSNGEFRVCPDGRLVQAIELLLGAYVVPYGSAVIFALNWVKR
jgi:hypothetical protein